MKVKYAYQWNNDVKGTIINTQVTNTHGWTVTKTHYDDVMTGGGVIYLHF